MTPHLRQRESFGDRFRFLPTDKPLIQFFFGLMIKLIIPAVGFSSPLPKFVGAVDDLFSGGCGYWEVLAAADEQARPV